MTDEDRRRIMTFFSAWWCSVAVVVCCVSVGSATVLKEISVENRLITRLMTNYSKYGRPISDVTQPVNVYISFYLTQLMSLEEKNQILTTFGWLETFWQDDYLKWSPADYDGLTQVVLSPQLVWLPDFGVENSAKSIYNELFYKRFRVSVTHDGLVNWVPGGKFVTSCQLDITFYPFDDQMCNIDLVDWAYHGLQVKLINGSDRVGLDAYTHSGEWDILRTEATSGDQFYESDPGVPFPRVRFTLYLRRKPMFYLINIITPCMMMSLLSVLVFYLPPDSGEKVSLGITVLLSFSVFLLLVAENVPKTSEYIPLLGIYLTLIMGMTALSILFCVVVLNLHHEEKNTPVPHWLRCVYNSVAFLLCVRHYSSGQRATLFPLIDVKHSMHHNNMSYRRQAPLPFDGLLESAMYGDDGRSTSTNHKAGSALEEILQHLRQVTGRLKESEEQDIIRLQWKMLAKLLDRFFLILFVLLVVVSSLVLLVFYPLFGRTNFPAQPT